MRRHQSQVLQHYDAEHCERACSHRFQQRNPHHHIGHAHTLCVLYAYYMYMYNLRTYVQALVNERLRLCQRAIEAVHHAAARQSVPLLPQHLRAHHTRA
jgi:hypothetical protein